MALAWLPVLILCAAPSASQGAEKRPAPKENYPQFSWDRIPLYMHVRKARSYTEKEIAFLARFPLITFEKDGRQRGDG